MAEVVDERVDEPPKKVPKIEVEAGVGVGVGSSEEVDDEGN